jgi:hypothetical protein
MKVIFFSIFLLTLSTTGFSAQISLAWDPNSESNLSGYRLYYGTSSGNYSQTISVGLATGYTVTLTNGGTYYFALTAVSAEGLESGYSNEVVYSSSNPAQATLTVNKQGMGTGTVSGTGIGCGSDCSEVLTPGAVVALTAGPAGSSVFAGWAGACTGTNTSCTVTVNGNTSVAATFNLRSYSITATAGVKGSITPAGTTVVTHGGSQVYTITPAPGYQVVDVRVDGASVGALSDYTFDGVAAAHTIEAAFAVNPISQSNPYTLKISKKGSGKGGVVNNPPGSSFKAGTVVTLTSISDPSSTFGGWSGACRGNNSACTVTMSGNRSVTAAFNLKTYFLTATAGLNGSITPSGSTTVNYGGSQTYTITPASGFQVAEVRVDGIPVGAPTSYTLNTITAAHTIAATFAKKTETHTLIVSNVGFGKGIVVAIPSGSSFSSGTEVILTASPDSNSVFAGWSGACIGNDPTCTLTIYADSSVTASFNSKEGSVFKVYLPLMKKGVAQIGQTP